MHRTSICKLEQNKEVVLIKEIPNQRGDVGAALARRVQRAQYLNLMSRILLSWLT